MIFSENVYMSCPDTPKSLIGKILDNADVKLWQKSWERFYETYLITVRQMTVNSFKKIGWKTADESVISGIISETFLSLQKAFENGNYTPEKYRFRGFLKTIVYKRTLDYIRRQNSDRLVKVESIEITDMLSKDDSQKCAAYFDTLEDDEAHAYRMSLIMDIWESIRHSFEPKTCLCFEMRMLEDKPVADICKQLGVEREKVDKSVHRVLKRLREETQKEYYKKEIER